MSYGKKEWQQWVLEEKEGIEHIKKAWEAGINVCAHSLTGLVLIKALLQTFDTANMYSDGESERILGKAIKEIGAPRERFVILTKVYFPCLPDGFPQSVRNNPEEAGLPNWRGLSRKHIFESVQASLKRLGTEYIDVLQCHRFDYDTPIEETMRALHDVVQMGWVRYIGMSSCYAWQFHMMQSKCILTDTHILVHTFSRLRNQQQPDALYLHAKLPLPALSRRGARNAPRLQGR